LEETSAWGGFFCIYLTKMMEMWYNRIGEGMAMKKSFDELTIADDYMFCTVMQDEELCKELLSMILKNKVGKIVRLFKQKSIENQIASKGVRLDIMIEDDTGKLYDIEMQTTDERNLPERMRYYQCAIDNSAINKGGDYNDLPDTFIIFLCTFDYLQEGLPVYTIRPSCRETGQEFNDRTTKIIVNSTASEQAEENLKAFLSYMNGQSPNTAFTRKLEEKVSQTKEDEEKRREYMLLKSFEMDARRAGIQEGIAQGRSEGIAQGSYQTKLETATAFKRLGIDIAKIAEGTGLSCEEIEKL